MKSVKHTAGFTLLEFLIAVMVFAAVSMISFTTLDSILNSREHIEKINEDFQKLQMALTILQRDFNQIAFAPIRDEYGDPREAIEMNDGTDRLIEFSRSGWNNPGGRLRSTMQRVGYTLEDNTLYREYWLQFNRAAEEQSVRAALLKDIETVEFEFLDNDEQWHDQWPPINFSGNMILPEAIRINITFVNEDELSRVFDITAAGAAG